MHWLLASNLEPLQHYLRLFWRYVAPCWGLLVPRRTKRACVYVCVYVCVSVCICVYVSMSVCVYVCLSLSSLLFSLVFFSLLYSPACPLGGSSGSLGRGGQASLRPALQECVYNYMPTYVVKFLASFSRFSQHFPYIF